MDTSGYEHIISQIVSETRSDLIYFLVIILIGLVIFLIPFYTIKRKMNKDDKTATVAEKRMLIDVINKNTDIISTLKVTIDYNNQAISTMLSNIEKVDANINNIVNKISKNQDISDFKLDTVLSSNDEISQYVEKSADQYDILIDISKNINTLISETDSIKNSINHNEGQ